MSSFSSTRTLLETTFGVFEFWCFSWGQHEEDNLLALWRTPTVTPAIVRVQSACYTAEIFRSLDCDCHAQLEQSHARIAQEGGLLVYMLCDGRGAGLFNKVKALELQRTRSLDTSDAYHVLNIPQDPRDYSRVLEVLKQFQLTDIRLLTNNPRKVDGLVSGGIAVEREPLEIPATARSRPYLLAKATKMGHLLGEFTDAKLSTT